jgi:hypothetical protein
VRPATEKNNTSFTDFKYKVFHNVVQELMSTVRMASQVGEHMVCADGVQRRLYPSVMIMASDYDEM